MALGADLGRRGLVEAKDLGGLLRERAVREGDGVTQLAAGERRTRVSGTSLNSQPAPVGFAPHAWMKLRAALASDACHSASLANE